MFKLFDPAFHLLVTITNYLEETITTAGHIVFSAPPLKSKYQVFEILVISPEIPSISKKFGKPCVSKFLIQNT